MPNAFMKILYTEAGETEENNWLPFQENFDKYTRILGNNERLDIDSLTEFIDEAILNFVKIYNSKCRNLIGGHIFEVLREIDSGLIGSKVSGLNFVSIHADFMKFDDYYNLEDLEMRNNHEFISIFIRSFCKYCAEHGSGERKILKFRFNKKIIALIRIIDYLRIELMKDENPDRPSIISGISISAIDHFLRSYDNDKIDLTVVKEFFQSLIRGELFPPKDQVVKNERYTFSIQNLITNNQLKYYIDRMNVINLVY